MVGYVVGCSERYSVVLPLLNTDFRTSGKIVGDDHFGSISWSGSSPYEVDMTELSKYAEIEVGAEVVSSGLSHYFPADVKIGYVESFELNDSQTAYDVKIRLAADMTRLGNVILIENMDFGEMSTSRARPNRARAQVWRCSRSGRTGEGRRIEYADMAKEPRRQRKMMESRGARVFGRSESNV